MLIQSWSAVLSCSLLAVMGAWTSAQESENASEGDQAAIKKIVGSYKIRSGKTEGVDTPKEHIDNVTVKITEKTITTYDDKKQERYNTTYKLHSDKRPWHIVMTVVPKKVGETGTAKDQPTKPETSEGLIELSDDGKTLKLVYALPGHGTPKDFKGAKNQNMFEMTRLEIPGDK